MQNQIPNLERYILAELQDMNAADTYIVSADIWVDCEQTHQVVNVLKKSDNTLVTSISTDSSFNIETDGELRYLEKQIEENLRTSLRQSCFKEKSYRIFFLLFQNKK
jgi:hypothetical protein